MLSPDACFEEIFFFFFFFFVRTSLLSNRYQLSGWDDWTRREVDKEQGDTGDKSEEQVDSQTDNLTSRRKGDPFETGKQ